MRFLRGSLAALATALLFALPAAAAGQDPQASLPDVEDEVMCPICGTLLEHSDAPQAERQRELIRGLIEGGRDKDEIKDALVAEYGPEVLAVPDDEGFDLVAWVVPAIGVLLAAGLIGWSLRRRHPRTPEAGAPAPGDAERLREDLSSYDL